MMDEQEEIKDWFNKTYQKRGERYLRPQLAYRMFLPLVNSDSKRALDIGCGPGLLLQLLECSYLEIKQVSVVSIDRFFYVIRY